MWAGLKDRYTEATQIRPPDHRDPGDTASECGHRARVSERVRAARRDDPVRAVDRCAREHGDAGVVQAISGRAGAGQATPAKLEPQIVSTGFFRQKSKALIGMAQQLVAEHGGEVPADMDLLTKLPGVGRKTANVVLGHALGVPGLPVDRHVLRVSNRIGIAEGDDPEKVEAQLTAALPKEMWTLASDVLILHGRRICKPKPLCDQCSVCDDCDYYRLVVSRGSDPSTSSGSSGAKSRDEKVRAAGTKRRGRGDPPEAKHDARKVRAPRR